MSQELGQLMLGLHIATVIMPYTRRGVKEQLQQKDLQDEVILLLPIKMNCEGRAQGRSKSNTRTPRNQNRLTTETNDDIQNGWLNKH